MIVQQIKKNVLFEFKSLPIVMLDDRQIYNTKRNKFIQEKLNCRSLGYWIDRRFYTKSKLNRLAIKMKSEIVVEEIINCPF